MVESDIIVLILDHVDDRGTLFSLLTVNKQIFQLACGTLYRDPFRFFRDGNRYDESTVKNRLSLVRLLLDLSPAVDEDANLVRRAFDVPLKQDSRAANLVRRAFRVPRKPTTMLDYLSFIRCVRWEYLLEHPINESKSTILKYQRPDLVARGCNTFVRSTLTWCFCGHQLGQLRELEIEPDVIERYIAAAPQLRCLRTIVIATYHGFPTNLTQLIYPTTASLVQKLQEHHGKGLVRDCCFSLPPEYNADADASRWNLAMRKQLPLILPRGLRLALPIRPIDSYLSRVMGLATAQGSQCQWSEIAKEHSDLSAGQILQRGRSLVDLSVYFVKSGVNDPGVLAWAADEARERAAGRLLAPAVPLKRLNLGLYGLTAVDMFRVLMDAIRGFRQSLVTLYVRTSAPEAGEEYSDLPQLPLLQNESMVMSRLDHLMFSGHNPERLDIRLLQSCPNLTRLEVTLEEFKDPNALPPSWPVLLLPCLTWMTLSGRATNLFDPASFHGMPQLQTMSLSFNEDPDDSSASAKALLDRWTWDWNLPELTKFRVWAESRMAEFCLRILRGCPKLQELSLEFPRYGDKEPCPIDVLSTLNSPTQDIFPALHTLEMTGRYCLQPEDLQVLMGRALPGLKNVSMHSVSPCTPQQVVEYTRHHPSLKYVSIRHELPTDAEELQMGLEYGNLSASATDICYYTFEDVGTGRYFIRKKQ
ncbi:hypothetical protein DFQ27_006118 [Actinomortierella ambigua]|uniref:Uncharacterized protein n=1 Tax=Actinomortierella ambigua TaxID=1343610 RepID=A0A9P6Q015_9FUNG|nr:hypothetical protein DFQ27_006118 [Actinomortierella ambigua]